MKQHRKVLLVGSLCRQNHIRQKKAKPFDIGIIQVHAPTSARPEEEVEEFYEDLDKAKTYLKSQSKQIIMGDFKAKVGSDKVENIVGPCGIGDTN